MDPYQAPATDGPVVGLTSVVIGLVCGLYALLFGCACGFFLTPAVLFTDLDPATTTADRIFVVLCNLAYVGAFVPAVGGVLRLAWFRSALVGWALLLLVVESGSTAVYVAAHDDPLGQVLGTVCVFVLWPVLCLGAVAVGLVEGPAR